MASTLCRLAPVSSLALRRCLLSSRSVSSMASKTPSTGYLVKKQSASTSFAQRHFVSAKPNAQKKTVTLHFVSGEEKRTVQAKLGDNLLDVIIDNDVDLDGFGACEGTLACSTCHLVFSDENFESLPEKPTDEELDMLDLAFGLEDTSRLGCQVIVTPDMDGWEIVVPEGVSDAREP